MRKELQNLLELLSTEEYHTAEELSEHLGISQENGKDPAQGAER